MMQFGEKTIKKEEIYKGSLVELEKHVILTQDGKEADREIIHHVPAVAIIAINNENKIILVRQYRKAIEKAILEIPAGLVDPDEDWQHAAKRELEEETGCRAKHWEKLVGTYLSPGYLDEFLQLYSANEIYPVENPLAQDEDEHIEVVTLSLEEAEEAIVNREIIDIKTVFAINYWKLEQCKGVN